jgi:hypothetical protein
MKTTIKGDLAILDNRTRDDIAAAPERVLNRLKASVSELELKINHLVPSGATSCEISVRLSDRIQIMARHRDLDAAKATYAALERARLQITRTLQRRRKRRPVQAGPVTA